MGVFDIFSTGPAQQAAAAQTAGLNAGYNVASGDINQAIGALNQNYGTAGQQLQTNYTSALQPYLQNYGQAQAGVTQLGNVLGLNGPQGSGQALQTLTNNPGYQFALQQGQGGVNAAAQAGGTGASGNQQIAALQFGQGAATNNYNNYVNQLLPFLGQSNAAAGGINQTYQNLGTGQAGISTGLGNATAGQYGNLANLGWQTQTGIGNANANADLAAYNASANELGAISGFLGSGAKVGATTAGAGGAGTAIGQGLGSVFSAFLAEGGDAEAGRSYVVGDQPGYAAKLARFLNPLGEAFNRVPFVMPSDRSGRGLLDERDLTVDPVTGRVIDRYTGERPEYEMPMTAGERNFADIEHSHLPKELGGGKFDWSDFIQAFHEAGTDKEHRQRHSIGQPQYPGAWGEPSGLLSDWGTDDLPTLPLGKRPWFTGEKPEGRWAHPELGVTGYASGGDPPVGRRALVGEGSQHHDQSPWFDSLVAKLQLDADLANVRRRHMAPSDWDLGKFDDRRPPRPTYEDSARGLQGFQSGGYPPVGEDALVGEGASPKPELFVPHDGSDPIPVGLNGPEVIVPQVPGTVIPNHALRNGGDGSIMRSYEPSYMDRLARFLIDQGPQDSPTRGDFVGNILGTRGLGPGGGAAEGYVPALSRTGFADVAPVASGLSAADRDIQSGEYRNLPADVVAAAAPGVLGKVARPVVTGIGAGAGALGLGEIINTAMGPRSAEAGQATKPELDVLERATHPQPIDLGQADKWNARAKELENEASQRITPTVTAKADRKQAQELRDKAAAFERDVKAAEVARQNAAEVAFAAAQSKYETEQANLPFTEKHPDWSWGIGQGSWLGAAVAPYVARALHNANINKHVVEAGHKLIDQAEDAIANGDATGLRRALNTMRGELSAAREAEREFRGKKPTPAPSILRQVWDAVKWPLIGGGVTAEGGAAPNQFDAYLAPAGSEAREKAFERMRDPKSVFTNVLRGFGAGMVGEHTPVFPRLQRPPLSKMQGLLQTYKPGSAAMRAVGDAP